MSATCKFKVYDTCIRHNNEKKVLGGGQSNVKVSVYPDTLSISSINGQTNNPMPVPSQSNEYEVTVIINTEHAPAGTAGSCTLKYTNNEGNSNQRTQSFTVTKKESETPTPPPVEPSDIYWCKSDGTKIDDVVINGGEFLPYVGSSGTVTSFDINTLYFKVVNGEPSESSSDSTRLNGSYSLVGNGIYKLNLTCNIPVNTNKDVVYTISCDGKSIKWTAHLADKFVDCYVKMNLKITAHWEGAIKYYVEYTPTIYNNTGGIWEGKVTNPSHPDTTYSFWVDRSVVMQQGAADGSYTIGVSPDSYIEYRDKKYYISMMPTDFPNSGHYWIEGHEIESLKVVNGGPVENNNNIRIDIDPSVPIDMQSKCECTYVSSNWDASAPVQIKYSFD